MATIATSSRTRPIAFAGGCLNEVHKGLLGLVAGWRQTLIQMVGFPIFYLLIVLFMGSGRLREDLLLPTLLGMVALTFIHEQVNRVFWGYLGDIQSGVLEQTYLTRLPSAALILGRQVAAVISALPTALAVLLTGVVTITLNGGDVPFDPQVLVPMAAIVIGTCGLALVLCGLTLAFKRIEIVTQLSVAVYTIAGGTLVPLTAMPGWVATLSRLLVPIAPGIEAMRDILLQGRSLATLHTGWGLGWLLIQPILITTAGVVLFTRLEHLARRRGTLGRY
jgi:ABC-2 type transport system permease protein